MQTSVKRERPKQKSVWQGLSQHTLGGMFAMHQFLNSPYQLTLMLSLCIYYLCLTHCILREPMYGHLWYYWLNVFLTLLWLFVCIYFIFPYFFCTFPMKYNTNYPKGVLIWFQNRHMVVNSVIASSFESIIKYTVCKSTHFCYFRCDTNRDFFTCCYETMLLPTPFRLDS